MLDVIVDFAGFLVSRLMAFQFVFLHWCFVSVVVISRRTDHYYCWSSHKRGAPIKSGGCFELDGGAGGRAYYQSFYSDVAFGSRSQYRFSPLYAADASVMGMIWSNFRFIFPYYESNGSQPDPLGTKYFIIICQIYLDDHLWLKQLANHIWTAECYRPWWCSVCCHAGRCPRSRSPWYTEKIFICFALNTSRASWLWRSLTV